MARLLRQLITGPDACHYLQGVAMTTESRVMIDVSPPELEELLALGWRRFGPVYFRPVCAGCSECVSVRVPVESFAPSANMKRVLKRAQGLRVEIGRPVCDELRLSLHARWHASREGARGWEQSELDREAYALQFCFPHPSALEFSYWEGERLVAVGITDRTPRSLSAVYCYYDPADEKLSPGTFNVLTCIARAKEEGLSHVYLGYRVDGCASLRYKGRFVPQQRLVGRPEEGERPQWRGSDGDDTQE
jgi:leucyl-tRNA---protein transferase